MKQSRAFKRIIDNRYSIRTGNEVPCNAVNLAHYYSEPLSPIENIILGEGDILALSQNDNVVAMYSDADCLLKNLATHSADIDGSIFEITDRFYENTPLYYRYILTYNFSGGLGVKEGVYIGDSIQLKDIYGNNIPDSYKYIIYLSKNSNERIDKRDSYVVEIFTSFRIENNYKINCIYNAVLDDGIIKANFKENINPQPFFERKSDVFGTLNEPDSYYVQKSKTTPKSSNIYISSAMEDTRNPQHIKITLTITFGDDTITTLNFPQTGGYIPLYNVESIIDSEKDMFKDDMQIISKDVIASYYSDKNITSIAYEVFEEDGKCNTVDVYVDPDGKGRLYAKSTLKQDTIKYSKLKKLHKSDNKILTTYNIKIKDKQVIKLLPPREGNSLSSWYIRVQNGRHTINHGSSTYRYFIPEYYDQVFDSELGFPYKRVTGERPTVISSNTIRLKCTPIYSAQDGSDIVIVKKNTDGTTTKLEVVNWNSKDGTVTLNEFVEINEVINVDYYFEEDSFVYTGYFDDKISNKYIGLDCNPNRQHFYTTMTNKNTSIDTTTFSLLNKIIFVYMKPAIVDNGKEIISSKQVLFHTFAPLTSDVITRDKLLLVGYAHIRANSSLYSLQITDTRTRGGGVLEEIRRELALLIEPEFEYYWDVGYWDGDPFNDSAVIVIRIDKRVLVKNGGKFTETEIEKAVHKHLAFGTLPIIEYVDAVKRSLQSVGYVHEYKKELR